MGYAFEGCRNLQTVILPDKMERIDEGAFARCEKIQDITFPDNIKEIGSFSFWLTGLSDIFIPENVSYIALLWNKQTIWMVSLQGHREDEYTPHRSERHRLVSIPSS